jgi:hypothetical protein
LSFWLDHPLMDANAALGILRAASVAGQWMDLTGAADRDVPADALYAVLVDDAPPRPRAVRVRGARILGALDLEAATLRCPLHLDDCDLADAVTLSEALAPSIRLIGCRLGSLIAEQLRTRGSLGLTSSTVTGPVMLQGAHIAGQLLFGGAQLSSQDGIALNADGLVVDQDMFCGVEGGHRFTATGQVRLPAAHIGGQLTFSGAQLSNEDGTALNADGLVVDQHVFCSVMGGHRFTASGEVRLLVAHIGGQLTFSGARLSNERGPALHADGLVVDQDAFFGVEGEHRLTAKGEVRLLSAHIGGQLTFSGAHLSNEHGPALNADGLAVDQHVYCTVEGGHRFIATGGVDLQGAQIGGAVTFVGAQLSNQGGPALSSNGLLVNKDVFCGVVDEQQFTATGGVTLQGARIGGLLAFLPADVSDAKGAAVNLFEGDVGWLRIRHEPCPDDALDLRRARVTTITVETGTGGASWPPARLAGCQYDRLESEPPSKAEARLRWLKADLEGYSPQPYEQLAAAYRRSGDDEAARTVLIAKQKVRRTTLGKPGKLWSYFLGATVAHGHRPSQALGWLILLLVLGTVLFGTLYTAAPAPATATATTAHASQPSTDDFTAAKADPAPFQPFIYTLDVLIPVVSLGQETSWNAQGSAQAAAMLFAVFGWLLTAALLTGITARRQ